MVALWQSWLDSIFPVMASCMAARAGFSSLSVVDGNVECTEVSGYKLVVDGATQSVASGGVYAYAHQGGSSETSITLSFSNGATFDPQSITFGYWGAAGTPITLRATSNLGGVVEQTRTAGQILAFNPISPVCAGGLRHVAQHLDCLAQVFRGAPCSRRNRASLALRTYCDRISWHGTSGRCLAVKRPWC